MNNIEQKNLISRLGKTLILWIILGFYVCPAIAWVLGWRRDYAVILIIVGFVSVSIITLLSSIGILELILK